MDEAEAVGDEVTGLLHSKLDSKGLDSLVVALQLFKTLQDLSWHLGLSELAHSLEAIVAENWHDAGEDLALDASPSAVGDPVKENLVFKEELGDDEVGPSVHLFLQVANVVIARSRL